MKLLKIISTVVLLLFTINTIAQETESETESETKNETETKTLIDKLKFGVKGGFTFATITKGDFKQGPDARICFYLGGYMEVPIIDDSFSIQTEILYSQQGFERNYSLSGIDYKSEYHIDYINIPVLAKLYILKGFSFEAGPQFGFKINEKADLDTTNDEEGGNLDEINSFDISVALGFTFQFEEGFFVNGRFNRGFTEVITNSDSKNAVIQMGIGYKF